MNKRVAILGACAGAVCAILLTTGLPSLGALRLGCSNGESPIVTRDLSWSGNDKVEVHISTNVHFTAGPQWRAVAHGPEDVVKHLRFEHGRLEFDRSMSLCNVALNVELTGPEVRRWVVMGSGDVQLDQLSQTDLDISSSGSGSVIVSGKVERTQARLHGSGDMNLDRLLQSDLDLSIHGSGSAIASGHAEHARVTIDGSGDAKLGELNVNSAEVAIRGSGNVDIGAEKSADIQIFGSGDVHLTKQPPSLQSHVHGSGSVVTG